MVTGVAGGVDFNAEKERETRRATETSWIADAAQAARPYAPLDAS